MFLSLNPFALQIMAAVLGLLVGSFLNVVIYRLPRMMESAWKRDAAMALDLVPKEEPTFNLITPRSRCSSCGHIIRWFENIPVLSYVFLRGKCAQCRANIGLRYPIVEIVTACLFYFCFYRYGSDSILAGLLCVFCAVLVALTLIDWDTTLLPDQLTLSLLWLGIMGAASGHSLAPTLHASIWGAAVGYLSLWIIYWAFKLLTGKEGMGFGDFKLFAALGAWFGVELLLPIILISSIVGLIIALALKVKGNLREGGYIPFGPFLAGAGFTVLLLGGSKVLALMSMM